MSQVTDWSVDNAGGAAVRAQLNGILAAIQGCSSGSTAPSPTVAGMEWLDTGVTPAVMRVRNAANSAWIALSPETVPALTLRGNNGGSAAAINNVTMAQLRVMMGMDEILGTPGGRRYGNGQSTQWFFTSAIASGANVAFTLPISLTVGIQGLSFAYANTSADQAVGSNYLIQVRLTSLTSVTIRNLGPNTASYYITIEGE